MGKLSLCRCIIKVCLTQISAKADNDSARCCCSKGDKHILVSTINHAGLDALNAFQIYNSFLTYIGLLSAGKPMRSACGISTQCY